MTHSWNQPGYRHLGHSIPCSPLPHQTPKQDYPKEVETSGQNVLGTRQKKGWEDEMQEFHGNMLGWESKLQQNEGKMTV